MANIVSRSGRTCKLSPPSAWMCQNLPLCDPIHNDTLSYCSTQITINSFGCLPGLLNDYSRQRTVEWHAVRGMSCFKLRVHTTLHKLQSCALYVAYKYTI